MSEDTGIYLLKFLGAVFSVLLIAFIASPIVMAGSKNSDKDLAYKRHQILTSPHTFYSFTNSRTWKICYFYLSIGFLSVILAPAFAFFVCWNNPEIFPVVWLIFGIIGIGLSILFYKKVARNPRRHVTVDLQKLRIFDDNGEKESFTIRDFSGVIPGKRTMPPILLFKEEEEEKRCLLYFLSDKDINLIITDVKFIKENGRLPVFREVSEKYAKEYKQVMPASTEPKKVVQEAADPRRLKELCANLDPTVKEIVLEYCEAGEQMKAIKHLQTHFDGGLIAAREIVVNYKKYLK